MKRIEFYNNNRSDDLLHIETENCIVNIRVNLKDAQGNELTGIEIIPDDNDILITGDQYYSRIIKPKNISEYIKDKIIGRKC